LSLIVINFGIKFIQTKMKFTTSLLVIAALFAGESSAITLQSAREVPAPTAADTPTSGYYGADEDDVMNNIFNHYAVETTNAAGQPTGTKVLYKDACQKAAAEILLVSK